jgi:hypothetical protein
MSRVLLFHPSSLFHCLRLGPFAIVQSRNIPRKFNETSEVMLLRFAERTPNSWETTIIVETAATTFPPA